MSSSCSNAFINAGSSREMREDAQLNLRIVRRHQDVIGFARNKGQPNPPAFIRADRDVLQIRVGHAQSPGDRAGLIEAAVHSAGSVGFTYSVRLSR